MVSLPIYKNVFATAKQTGYTTDGVCVPVRNIRDYCRPPSAADPAIAGWLAY